MKKPINYISIILVLIYLFNSDICDFFYLEDINWFHLNYPLISQIYDPCNDAWWRLRGIIYTINFVLAYYAHAFFNKTRFSEIIFFIGGDLCLSDLGTRIITTDITRTFWDSIILIITVLYFTNKFFPKEKQIK